MTTYYPFSPSRTAAPRFSPALDGAVYNCVCLWNLFAQRYYLNCYDLSGALVFSRAIVETGSALSIETLTWSELTGKVTVTTTAPHGYAIGSVNELTIAGCTPAAYNGAFACTATGPNTLTYALGADPGQNVVAGSATFMVNLAGDYFAQSTLIYRNQQFEVSP